MRSPWKEGEIRLELNTMLKNTLKKQLKDSGDLKTRLLWNGKKCLFVEWFNFKLRLKFGLCKKYPKILSFTSAIIGFWILCSVGYLCFPLTRDLFLALLARGSRSTLSSQHLSLMLGPKNPTYILLNGC